MNTRAVAATKSQIIMMAATLDRDRDTASGATDAPHLPVAARNVRKNKK